MSGHSNECIGSFVGSDDELTLEEVHTMPTGEGLGHLRAVTFSTCIPADMLRQFRQIIATTDHLSFSSLSHCQRPFQTPVLPRDFPALGVRKNLEGASFVGQRRFAAPTEH